VVISSPFFPTPSARATTTRCPGRTEHQRVAIKNLNHLVEVLRDAKAEFITVEFDGRRGETMVFPERKWRLPRRTS